MNPKFKLFLILLLLHGLTLPASYSQEGYTIKGKIKGLHDTECYLGNYYGDKRYVKDTAKVDKDGGFIFKGDKKLDGGIYFIVLPGKTNQKLFEILIDKEQNFYVETDTSSKIMEHVKIKGSEDNILFYKYWAFIAEEQGKAEPIRKRIAKIKEDSLAAVTTKKDSIVLLQAKISTVEKNVEKFKDDFIKDHPGTFLAAIFRAQKDVVVPETPTLPNGKKDSLFPYRYYKDHFWDNIPPSDDRLLRTPIFHGKLKYFFDKVVVQHPDSIIKEADILVAKTNGNKETFKYLIWYLTLTYENNAIMGMDAVFVDQVEKYYITRKAYWVDSIQIQKIIHKGLTLKPLLLGKPAPPMIMQDSLDKNIALYDVKSKYTVLIFWDPDCGHCQKVVPKLKEHYDKSLKAKGVQVYSVDIEDVADKWKKFIVEKKLNFINVHDKYRQYALRQMYDIYSTPVIYILDENKKIRAKRIDVDQVDGFIDHLEKLKQLEKGK